MDPRVYYSRTEEISYSESELERYVYTDYNNLIDLLGFLIQGMKGEKFSTDCKHIFFSEPLAKKFTMHAMSLIKILQGVTFNFNLLNYEFRTVDISSAYVLFRAMLENYLTLYYLFIQPNGEEPIKFRCLLYEISGLNARQGYETISDFSKSRQDSEKEKLEELILKLKDNPVFQSLEKKIQNKIISDRSAKLYGWEKIILQSELYQYLFRQSWLLACNHAHSEYISILQIRDMWFDEKEIMSTRDLLITVSMALISVFIMDFMGMFKQLENIFNESDSEIKRTVNFFDYLGRGKDPFDGLVIPTVK